MYHFLVKLYFVILHMSSNSMGAPSNINEEIDIFDSMRAGININDELDIFDSDNLLLFDMPKSCSEENFCFEKGDEYPEKEIKQLLPTLVVKDRIGTDLNFRNADESPDCPANITFVNKPIYYIRDEKNKVRAVVQSENFTQIYSAKWCQRPGRITYKTAHFLEGSDMLKTFEIECVNTYMHFDFLVLTDEGKAETVKAKNGIPVCCSCRYSKPGGH